TSEAAAKVLSSLSRYTRLPPGSTTAMAPPGALLAFAYFTASATTFLAASREIVLVVITCALAEYPTIIAIDRMKNVLIDFIICVCSFFVFVFVLGISNRSSTQLRCVTHFYACSAAQQCGVP